MALGCDNKQIALLIPNKKIGLEGFFSLKECKKEGRLLLKFLQYKKNKMGTEEAIHYVYSFT